MENNINGKYLVLISHLVCLLACVIQTDKIYTVILIITMLLPQMDIKSKIIYKNDTGTDIFWHFSKWADEKIVLGKMSEYSYSWMS